jgi:type VI secretion system protein ImpL
MKTPPASLDGAPRGAASRRPHGQGDADPGPTRQLLQSVVNVLGFALLVWFGGPLVAIADVRPLETQAARLIVLLAAGAAFLLAGPLRQWQLRRRNAALVDVLQPPAGAETLAPRFQQALTLLRDGLETTGGPPLLRWWRRRQQLVRLPWYLFIGAPGAGKTTALLNSGLRFPLADKLGTAPVRGVAGTRQCDWWFTQQAVFIDTAGRYTTQDSDAATDSREWRSFLGLLRKHRPRQPINGVLVTVSVPDLLAGGPELTRQCTAVNARLQELRAELGLLLPVYLLVTKADMLAGFSEFFDVLDGEQRAQVWGTTLAYMDGAKGRSPARPAPGALAADLSLLVERILAITLDRLQQESAPARRSPIYHFGAQLDVLLPALCSFADAALARADEAPRQPLRGVYLSSGTQEGNPIDRVLGAIARQHGVPAHALARPDGKGKAYFLNRLLQGVVIREAELAGDNVQRLRKQRLAWGAAAGVVALGLVGLIGAWLLSYGNNRQHIAGVGQRVQQLAQQAAAASPPRAPAATGASAAASSTRWLPLYELLRDLPQHGATPAGAAPPGHGLGLFQGARLARSAHQTYHRVLANTLAPVLAERLATELKQAEGDPALRYQTLKTYLMLVQPSRLDRATVRTWAAASFARGPDAPVDAAQRDEWLRHVDALLERNAFQGAVVLDGAAVQAARKALAAVPFPQRVLARLHRDADTDPPRRLDSWLGPSFALLFDVGPGKAAAVEMPALFTREGFTTRLLPRLDAVLQQLADEEEWVLGLGGQRSAQWRAEPAARAAAGAEVVKLHALAHAARWQAALEAWQLHRPADADALARLNTQLAASDSPLRKLLELVRSELRLVDPDAVATANPLAKLADAALAERFGPLRGYAGAPGAAAIERVLTAVSRFTLAAGADAGGAQVAQALQQEAAQAPAPFRALWTTLAETVLTAQQTALRQGVAARLDDVAAQCRALTTNRFPFSTSAVQNDVSLADFARLFGHDGLLDVFFRKELAPLVDTRARPWRWREGSAVAGDALLRTFERAEDIRRVFFSPGAPLPRLQFTLRPIEMDDALDEFSIDIDGQTLRYENGPRVQRNFTWPGPAAATRVTLRAKGLRGEAHDGPWALLRVLTRQAWERGESAAVSRVSVAVEGRRLLLDLGLQGSASTSVLAGLSSFRCPEVRP